MYIKFLCSETCSKELDVMERLNALLGEIGNVIWGPPMLILLVGTGIYLTIILGGLQFKTLGYALKLAFSKQSKADSEHEGDISHFKSLMTALAATIGTGNIAGVSTAIVSGGPGALFWMWVTAIVGMATKYAEAILAVKYRVKDEKGEMSGGPMYFLDKGLNMPTLGWLFAFFGVVASFGIGNLVQVNSVADAISESFGVAPLISGIVMAIFTAAVVIGGIKSIGTITGYMVPFMAVIYVVGGLLIILLNIDKVPAAIAIIFSDAFTGQAVAGGAIGTVIRYGVARGVFSNEAGLGSAPIAAAAAKTDYPGRQALVSMTGTFIDTIIVCSITGIAVVMTGLWNDGSVKGAALTTRAFQDLLPGEFSGLIVTLGLILFSYTTVLGWCYYGEKCLEYIAGVVAVKYYRIIFSFVIVFGATMKLETVWNIADIFNGFMAVPNLIGLLLLSKVVVSESKMFEKIRRSEKIK